MLRISKLSTTLEPFQLLQPAGEDDKKATFIITLFSCPVQLTMPVLCSEHC